ncbi:hypothetical protein B0H12DRAFT_47120 [Mycena haematopus]|nr:hypothetical protein B0H12DRAFT_47120 [Mycena haematopus]
MLAHHALAALRILLLAQAKIYETLLGAHDPETLESYGVDLLRFHQFCDRLGIPESDRMPADCSLLSTFVADVAGSCTGKCIRSWLDGLHLWHTYNDAPWHGDEEWLPLLAFVSHRPQLRLRVPLHNRNSVLRFIRIHVHHNHARSLPTNINLPFCPAPLSYSIGGRSSLAEGAFAYLIVTGTSTPLYVSKNDIYHADIPRRYIQGVLFFPQFQGQIRLPLIGYFVVSIAAGALQKDDMFGDLWKEGWKYIITAAVRFRNIAGPVTPYTAPMYAHKLCSLYCWGGFK